MRSACRSPNTGVRYGHKRRSRVQSSPPHLLEVGDRVVQLETKQRTRLRERGRRQTPTARLLVARQRGSEHHVYFLRQGGDTGYE